MDDDFDPYYAWLGIPPEEQPADYYRLLGVRRFEPNLDVISNAGDQRMVFIRTFQVGKRSALSQRILNEIAAAKGCLIDPDRRKAYDARLQAILAQVDRQAPVARPLPVQVMPPMAGPPNPADDAPWQIQLDQDSHDDDDPVPLTRGSSLVVSWFTDTVQRIQNIPFFTVAYGVLAIGLLALTSVLIWAAFGGARRPAVAKTSSPTVAPSQATAASPPAEPSKKSGGESPAQPVGKVPLQLPPAASAAKSVDNSSSSPPIPSQPVAADFSPLLQVLPGPFALPYQIRLSPDGNDLIFWRAGESQLRIYRVGKKSESVEFSAPGIFCAAASGNGILAGGTDKQLIVWSIPSPIPLWTTNLPGPAREIAISHDGEKIAVICDADHPIAVFSVQDRRALGPFDEDNSRISSVSVTNSRVAYLVEQVMIREIDARTGEQKIPLMHPGTTVFRQVCFNGNQLCASDDQSIYWLEPSRGLQSWTSKHRPRGGQIVWHRPGGGLVAMRGSRSLTLVKSPEDEVHSSLEWPGGTFSRVAFSDWGHNRMVTNGPDESLLVWDLDKLRGKSQKMYSSDELAAWKPSSPDKSTPLPAASVAPSAESKPGSLPQPAKVPDFGPLEQVDSETALAALRRAGVRNLPNEPNQVRTITLQGSQFANSDAKYIAPFTDLVELYCDDRPINGQALRYFQNLNYLTALSLGGTDIVDDDLVFVGGLKRLLTLRLHGTRITEKGLVYLNGLTELRDLHLPHDIGRGAIPAIAKLRELRFITPFPAEMNDRDLAQLAELSHLQSLDLQRARLTPAGYQSLKNFRQVSSIQLSLETPREALPCLSEMKLSSFNFPPAARDEDVSLLEHMRLYSVSLNESMTDAALERLTRYPTIDTLALSNSKRLSDEGMRHLSGINTLRELYLPPGIGNPGLKHISSIQTLQSIQLAPNCTVTDEGLTSLVGLPKLQSLMTSSQVTDGGCESLAQIKTLRYLSFNQSRIGAEGLKKLKALDQLENLALFGVPVNQDSAKALATLTQLRTLVLQSTGISPEGQAELRTALPKAQFHIHK